MKDVYPCGFRNTINITSNTQPRALVFGQGLVEYTLILVLVALSAYMALQNLGTKIDSKLGDVNSALSGSSSTATPSQYPTAEVATPGNEP